jgi:hypothetical protein
LGTFFFFWRFPVPSPFLSRSSSLPFLPTLPSLPSHFLPHPFRNRAAAVRPVDLRWFRS